MRARLGRGRCRRRSLRRDIPCANDHRRVGIPCREASALWKCIGKAIRPLVRKADLLGPGPCVTAMTVRSEHEVRRRVAGKTKVRTSLDGGTTGRHWGGLRGDEDGRRSRSRFGPIACAVFYWPGHGRRVSRRLGHQTGALEVFLRPAGSQQSKERDATVHITGSRNKPDASVTSYAPKTASAIAPAIVGHGHEKPTRLRSTTTTSKCS
jgi:hypothetical protein